MYAKDPALTFNFSDPYSPHALVPHLVKEGSEILDVGCNIGYLGEFLIKNKSCVCDGVDYNKKFLRKAKKRGYRNTYAIDLYHTDFNIDEKYNTILFVDILEHLPNPYAVLKQFVKNNLKRRGYAILCLPNIARFECRLSHLLGNFDYEESGIMHRDHLRFFTRKSALDMIQKVPLKIVEVMPTGLGARFGVLPTLTAFQFIFICKKR